MPIDINSAHPLSLINFSPLSLLRSQLYAHERGNINARENCNKESPAPMETEGLNQPGFGWAAPKCGRGCDCTDKEKRPPGDHVDSPPEAATTADGSPAFAALDMDTSGGAHDGGGDSSRSSFSCSSASPGNDKDAAVPLPVVESMLAKLRGAAEALVKRMRNEASEYAEEQVEGLQEEAARLHQELDSQRRSSGAFKAARTVREEKAAAEDGDSDSPAWGPGGAGRMQKSRALAEFRSFVDMECTVRKEGGGYEVNVNRRQGLKQAIVQEILGGVEGADKQDDPHIYFPYLPKWAQRILKTRSYIVGRVRSLLKHMTGRNEAERQDRRVVLSAVAAERVEFGDQSGMAASVRKELELPDRRGGCPYDAAAKQREKFDLQAAPGDALSVGGVVVVRGEVGELASIEGDMGTVKFEAEVTGGTRTWTETYPLFRIHRDLVSLRAPGRTMRSDALALDEVTIADIGSCWRAVCPKSPDMKGPRRRRVAPNQYDELQAQEQHMTDEEVWCEMKKRYPESASQIRLHDSQKVPNAMRDYRPWHIVKKYGDSCRCQQCENMDKYGRPRRKVAGFFRDHMEKMSEDGGVSAHPLMAELAAVLESKSKGEMCCCLVCGSGGLECAAGKCTESSCPSCGIARLWSNGLRPSITDSKGKLKRDAPKLYAKRVTWQYYGYRLKTVPKKRRARDEDEDWEQTKIKKELILMSKTGTVHEFLDSYEATAASYLNHRAVLAREKRAELEHDRNRRPGELKLDMDFAENLSILMAVLVQSEHWVTRSSTVFVMVFSHLCRFEWDKSTGALPVGAEVTVEGEMAGKALQQGTRWARVVSSRGSGGSIEYEVEYSDGQREFRQRSVLRHRCLKQEAHIGVSSDGKHDSYAMQHYVDAALVKLKPTIDEQKIHALLVHSDNAAQHFKSSKSLYYFSTLKKNNKENDDGVSANRSHVPHFACVVWHFGAPGHGKGVWDGLGGVLKNYIRQVQRSYMSYVERSEESSDEESSDEESSGDGSGDESPSLESPIKTSSGLITNAYDCYEQWVHHFGSVAWQERAEELSRAIRSFTFYWAGDNDIKRPATFPEHSRVVGIQSSYQYFFRRAGEVLVRKAPCWCQACTRTSLVGPAALHGDDYHVIKCHRRINDTYYEYESRCCKVLDGPGTGEPHKRANSHGHELAEGCGGGGAVVVLLTSNDQKNTQQQQITLGSQGALRVRFAVVIMKGG